MLPGGGSGPRGELDRLDVELIGELVADGRASYSKLAAQVGLSPAAARTRVLRLLNQKIITVNGRVDASAMGSQAIEVVLVAVDRSARSVADRLDAMPEATFVVCNAGPWGIVAELRASSRVELVQVQERLRRVEGVRDLEALEVVEYVKQDWSGLADELTQHRTSSPPRNPLPPDSPLDAIDQHIVDSFMRDGRTSFAELAEKTGRSRAAMSTRAQRLLDKNVIVVQTLVSQRVLGRGMFAGLLIMARGDARDLAAEVAAMSEATFVGITRGRFDLACEVWSRDTIHLLEVIDAIREMALVHRVDCYPYLDITKEMYRVGPDAAR